MRLKLRRISTKSGVVNTGPAHNSEAGCCELGHDNIILPAGTVADQQLSGLVPAHHHTDMGCVRVQGEVAGQGVRL